MTLPSPLRPPVRTASQAMAASSLGGEASLEARLVVLRVPGVDCGDVALGCAALHAVLSLGRVSVEPRGPEFTVARGAGSAIATSTRRAALRARRVSARIPARGHVHSKQTPSGMRQAVPPGSQQRGSR